MKTESHSRHRRKLRVAAQVANVLRRSPPARTCSASPAITVYGFFQRLQNARVCGEAQVIVRTKMNQLAPFDDSSGSISANAVRAIGIPVGRVNALHFSEDHFRAIAF